MIQLRHTGLYVMDLPREEEFYHQVFDMKFIVRAQSQSDGLVRDLLGSSEASVRISKLVTEQGQVQGYDDMLELVSVESPETINNSKSVFAYIYTSGCMHLAFGIHDMQGTLKKLESLGGRKLTQIHDMPNGNRCCFCLDPEGNGLELIERQE